MSRLLGSVGLCALAPVLGGGCSSDQTPGAPSGDGGVRDASSFPRRDGSAEADVGAHGDAGAPTCARILGACTPFDPGSGAVHECRRLGESRVEPACQAGLSGCEQRCGNTACLDLGALCHNVDKGTGPINECHALGHARVAKTCFARGAECFSLCSAALAAQGTGGAGSGPDAGGAGAVGGGGGSGGGGGLAKDASPDAVAVPADASPERG